MKSPSRILVLCDDFWHPAQVPKAGLAPLNGNLYAFDFIENAHSWSAGLMASYPTVILTKSNDVAATDQREWMTHDVQTAFAEYVANGNSLLAIHSGIVDYEQSPVLRNLLGGVFTHHPEQCPVTVEPKTGHPLTTGSASFMLPDEHYFIALDDSQADVFLTTKSEHGEQPGGWRRTEGDGRVAVLTPGHHIEVWLHPSYQTLINNCLQWCGGKH